MQVVVFSKTLKEKDIPHIQIFFEELFKRGIKALVYRPFFEEVNAFVSLVNNFSTFESYHDLVSKKINFFFTLGGDGTILEAVTFVRDSQIPIVGINLGRMGFLASIEKIHIPHAIDQLYRGMFTLESRSLLYLESNFPVFGDLRFALNDCTILKRDTSSMITIHTFINGAYLNSYWADGIIIATPTGSTGYSLSCGGPIVFPNSGNFLITPVAPHNLNVRPIVVSDNSVISLEIEGRAENFLCTLDSRFEAITSAHQLAIRKNDFNINLVRIDEKGFMDTIRNKLAWGIDTRNH